MLRFLSLMLFDLIYNQVFSKCLGTIYDYFTPGKFLGNS